MPYFTKKGNYLIAFFCVYAGCGYNRFPKNRFPAAKFQTAIATDWETDQRLPATINNEFKNI